MKRACMAVVAGAMASVASGQSHVVVPNANTNVGSAVSPFDTLTREFGRSYQQVFAASELNIPTGAKITGVTFRSTALAGVNLPAPWPSQALNWLDYEIYLGQAAVAPGSMSLTYSANVAAGTEIKVRDGAMTIPAGSWENGQVAPAANAWGNEITFTPYTYTGGDLVMTVRHGGHATAAFTRNWVDVVTNPAAPPAVTQCVAFSTQTSLTGTLAQSAPAIVRFTYDDAVCYPDCNQDGNLTVQDFGCFQTAFVGGNMYADCNQDTFLTVQDFGCFQTAFVAGCP